MGYHVSQSPTLGAIESTIRQGAAAGIIADADLATDLPTILANVTSRAASLNVCNKSLVLAVKDAVRKGFAIQGSGIWTGGALANVYSDAPGTWAKGFAVTI